MAVADSKRMNYRKAPPLPGLCAAEARAVSKAIRIIETRYGRRVSDAERMTDPSAAMSLARLSIGAENREVFLAMWLDAQHQLIVAERVAVGTLTQTAVYPREVVRAAIANNAAAVIFAHNHPSGHTKPSNADLSLTRVLTDALLLIDVKVLDHVIVSATESRSMKSCGLI